MNRNAIIIAAIVILAAIAAVLVFGERSDDLAAITTFEKCRDAGYPVMETYPEQCRTPDGRTFVRDVSREDGQNGSEPGQEAQAPVRNVSVAAGSSVSSPLTVTGEARGTWMFEASLPLKIVDAADNVIAQAPGQAQPDPRTGEINWMTADYVPFRATLMFAAPQTALNTFLVIEKDNPSGLPENAGEIRIPIVIGAAGQGDVNEGTGLAACRATGCSGQICAEVDMVSTCEFRPEYSCYKRGFASCERQMDGRCGWTANAELQACLANPSVLE